MRGPVARGATRRSGGVGFPAPIRIPCAFTSSLIHRIPVGQGIRRYARLGAMLVGHLAPIGPIAAATVRRWDPKWPYWTRLLPWVGAATGCVFPDLDIISNVLLHGLWLHLYYLSHSMLPYLPLLLLGLMLLRFSCTRAAGLTVMAFLAGVMSHLLLDAVSHGTVLFYPLWNGMVGWTFPRTGSHVLRSYLQSPNFWLEPGVLLAAAIGWLRRRRRTLGSPRPILLRRAVPRYLSVLPRHEGSREISRVRGVPLVCADRDKAGFLLLDRSRYTG